MAISWELMLAEWLSACVPLKLPPLHVMMHLLPSPWASENPPVTFHQTDTAVDNTLHGLLT